MSVVWDIWVFDIYSGLEIGSTFIIRCKKGNDSTWLGPLEISIPNHSTMKEVISRIYILLMSSAGDINIKLSNANYIETTISWNWITQILCWTLSTVWGTGNWISLCHQRSRMALLMTPPEQDPFHLTHDDRNGTSLQTAMCIKYTWSDYCQCYLVVIFTGFSQFSQTLKAGMFSTL